MGGKNSIPCQYQELYTLICLKLAEGIIHPLEDPYLFVEISRFLSSIEPIENFKCKLKNLNIGESNYNYGLHLFKYIKFKKRTFPTCRKIGEYTCIEWTLSNVRNIKIAYRVIDRGYGYWRYTKENHIQWGNNKKVIIMRSSGQTPAGMKLIIDTIQNNLFPYVPYQDSHFVF